MVYVNSKKYACESCIKGHRSSSCHHNDRPLFEIKKKGRPVSQCEKCREARQSRRIHAKCTCDPEKSASASSASGPSTSTPAKKGKRFIPTVPSLPNGLKDALKFSASVQEEGGESRRTVDVLLNPCHCKDVWNCKCRSQNFSAGSSLPRPAPAVTPSVFDDGLSALAHVAACCSPAPSPRFFTDEGRRAALSSTSSERSGSRLTRVDCPHPHAKNPERARGKSAETGFLTRTQNTSQAGPSVSALSSSSAYRPIRASPLAVDSGPLTTSFSSSLPTFPDSASTLPATAVASTSACGSSCGCGQKCVCVGCAQHSDSHTPASPTTGKSLPLHRANCPPDCPTCVDHDGGIELPGHKPSSTFLDQFFARAATLPSPPPLSNRTRSTSLDPTNVIVYPPALLKASDTERDVRGLAFGLVRIPKLECCGGKCSCPENSCGCGDSCEGCCAEDVEMEGGNDAASTSTSRSRAPLHRHTLPSTSNTTRVSGSPSNASASKRSCCS